MLKITNIELPLGYDAALLKKRCAVKLKTAVSEITTVKLLKRSVDARKKNCVHFLAAAAVGLKDEAAVLSAISGDKSIEPYSEYNYSFNVKSTLKKPPVVIGFGPAGMFAALILARAGAKPIVLERGGSVEERTAAVKRFRQTGELDTECNVQFGEGGAGTFSDGKLTTGTKDYRIGHVFREFVAHGAPKEILWQGKPHIGTDKLCGVVRSIRKEIEALGGTVMFGTRFVGYETSGGRLCAVNAVRGSEQLTFDTDSAIVAAGHSARDIFREFERCGVSLSRKNFAMGVRVEHLQAELNRCMYGDFAGNAALGAADYKLAVHLPSGRSLYSFCMCPGGEVIAAASEKDTVVTNGMSLFARNAVNANSALLVGINPEDFDGDNPLAGMELQIETERKAFVAGGGNYSAPVTLVGAFLKNTVPTRFGRVIPSYTPAVKFARPEEYLPQFITDTMRLGIPEFAKKIAVFRDSEAVITGAESRSSSPVRIDRGDSLQSVSVAGMFPCGEGAGYAGGIVSAAVDGIRCAEAVLEQV